MALASLAVGINQKLIFGNLFFHFLIFFINWPFWRASNTILCRWIYQREVGQLRSWLS
jgi:hypothetical protein